MSSTVLFDTSPVETRWIEQPLDHFDPKENRTWKMRYFENLEFWKPNGTIYLFIGGEGEASPIFLTTGILYELAKETKGAMFGSEHRYYGKSMPLNNSVTENLKYLSSRQALADLATLLETIRSFPKFKAEETKVVVIGGSYPGNLAAWMKLLYPSMVDAAIASSAPVLAKKDFFEYLEVVSDDYEQHGSEGCHDKIKEIFNRYETLFKTDEGIKKLMEEEKVCQDNDMTKSENQQLFFQDKASEFMVRAQYGNPNYIVKHCAKLMNTSQIVSRQDNDVDDDLNFWREESECFDYDFYNMIDEMKEIDWIISWIYQTCTEFGYYQSTTSDTQPFKNVPPELYYKMCTGMFGPEFDEERIDEGIEATNKLYGGLNPYVSHVVFVNGNMDPWSRLGILEDISYEAPAKVIDRASHCRDLFSNRKGDPEELVEGRQYVKYLIKKWIGAGDYRLK